MKKQKELLMIVVLFGLILVTMYFSLISGEISVSFKELISLFSGNSDQITRLLILDFRLPRIILAILAGAGLALSGTILQSVTHNPLADTGILGINAGAGLAVILFISTIETTASTTFVLPLVAFIGGMLSAICILVVSYNKQLGVTPLRMVLMGVVLSTGISAITLLLTTKLDSENYRFVTMWQAGSIWGSNWFFVCAICPWLIIGFYLSMRRHRVFDILQIGDEAAISLGISLKKERMISFFLVVALASSAIAVTGGISFLGLISPHIARRCGFVKHRSLLPISALIGSFLLILSDTIGRLALGTGEIPAGIVVAIIGAPYFLYLLLKNS